MPENPVLGKPNKRGPMCATPQQIGPPRRLLGSTRSRPGCFDPGVSHRGLFLKYWLPVLIWMALIFSGSTDLLSSQRTSRIIGPLVHWMFPGLSEETVGQVVFVVRKTAHLAEYAVLALLLWRALRRPLSSDPRPWSWREAAWALGLAALYAASDELHQSLVASRLGSVLDVCLDTAGAAGGLGIARITHAWRKRT
jgi:VanZ family protein